jgi:peptidoglycan/xylan/chitin deacetylase (PgdA/CDA1 family)
MSGLARKLFYGAFLYGGAFHLQGLRSRVAGKRLTILTMHRVDDRDADDPTSLPTLFISRRRFEGMLEFLGRHYRFVSLEQIQAALAGDETLPNNACHLTFDDAYQDVFDHALPRLKRAGIPATIYVPTEFADGTLRAFWWDECYYLLRSAWMRRDDGFSVDQVRSPGDDFATHWEPLRRANSTALARTLIVDWIHRLQAADNGRRRQQMDDMWRVLAPDRERFLAANRVADWKTVRSAMGQGFSFGSHTCKHLFLDCESEQTVRQELTRSKQEMEKQLGRSVDTFAYPGGKITDAVRDWVADAGYRVGMTTNRGINCSQEPPLLLKRVSIWNGSTTAGGEAFSAARLAFNLRRRIA